jgi:rSAM/selenodomain-associated transferase 2
VKIAVVIPALDEAERIAGAIESAAAPGVDVVVADGGSSDDTRARAAAAGARVVDSEVGRARQLARGVRETRSDAILFLHADTRLPVGFDVAVRTCLEDPGVVGGAFRFRFDDRSFSLRLIEWGARLRVALTSLPYGDQAIFVRRSALEQIGGVPQVPLMEDLDLVKALRRRGRVAILPQYATTSARRFRRAGILRTALKHRLVAVAGTLGVDRERLAAWVRR